MAGIIVMIIFLIIVLLVLASCIKIVPQASALILERLGAYKATWVWASILKYRSSNGWQSG